MRQSHSDADSARASSTSCILHAGGIAKLHPVAQGGVVGEFQHDVPGDAVQFDVNQPLANYRSDGQFVWDRRRYRGVLLNRLQNRWYFTLNDLRRALRGGLSADL